ncbi:MAG: hypothetical protein D9V47_02720 [Clostridia bacterium]|nr:MAG: hypothetical protein D9V47_02720 [Clostridia bacterium]
MLCEECKERPATVHITTIIKNQKSQVNLCEECAREYQQHWGFGFQPDFSIPQFLAALLQHEAPEIPTGRQEGTGPGCRACGLTYDEFRRTGRLGCAQCYNYFGDRLEPLLHRVHGVSRHMGKVPRRAGGTLSTKREIEQLRAELEKLVASEEYEKAARVRDRIRELEKKVAGNTEK